MKSEDELIEGDPWSVLPVKTSKFAKECKNIVLSNRNINILKNFENFDNLEALWLNNNKLDKIEGLEKNFRIKILSIQKNRLVTLEGCLAKMKFLRILFVNDNKLRNLDKTLNFLRDFSFLEELNLFGNPLAEEPEYKSRVIVALKSVFILDRHKILNDERIKSEQIVKEYNDPLSKKQIEFKKKLKVSEAYSVVEMEMFQEAQDILKRNRLREEEIQKKKENLVLQEKFDSNYFPLNSKVMKNLEKYDINEKDYRCPELDNNEIRRVINFYDPNNIGINKQDIQFCFLNIKSVLESNHIEINEKLFMNKMLDFYARASDKVKVREIKKIFFELLFESQKSKNSIEKFLQPTIEDKLKIIIKEVNQNEKSQLKDRKITEKTQLRNDKFILRKYTNLNKPLEVILNENKLEKAYI